jgi:putative MFS transporter
VHLRATGSGIIAASSKLGGILGAAFGVLGVFGNLSLAALLIAVPMLISAVLLLKSGIDTRGQRLEDIQKAVARKRVAVTTES